MLVMMVSLMQVRWLTWVTVRPARRRASVRSAPMLTTRLHCRLAPRAAPSAGAVNPDSIITPSAPRNHHAAGARKPATGQRPKVDPGIGAAASNSASHRPFVLLRALFGPAHPGKPRPPG